MSFWIEGSTVNLDRIEAGVLAADTLMREYKIEPHQAFLAHKAKLIGDLYNKHHDAAWLQARNICFDTCFGEHHCWDRCAKFIFK